MNQIYNGNQAPSTLRMLKGFFSRTSVLTATVASAILAALIIFQTIISGYSAKKVNMLSSLYYMFGDNSTAVVNIVFGCIVSLISILFFASLLTIYLKAKSGDNDSLSSGFSTLLFTSIAYIVIACITIIFAFASISVLRYQSEILSKKYDYREFDPSYYYNNLYSSGNAGADFFCYILYGTFAVLMGIGAVRLVLSMKKAFEGETPANRGSALFLIGSIGMASITCVSFFVSLGNLVIPDEIELNPINLLFSIINLLIFAAVSVTLFALIFVISNYSHMVNKVFRPSRVTSYYASYATNVYPNNAARPVPPTVSRQTSNTPPQSYSPYNGSYASTQPTPQVQPPTAPQNVTETSVPSANPGEDTPNITEE